LDIQLVDVPDGSVDLAILLRFD